MLTFGYSLSLMLRQRADDGVRRYRRRLVGLAILGLAHATLFFVGDILLSYAILAGVSWLALIVLVFVLFSKGFRVV